MNKDGLVVLVLVLVLLLGPAEVVEEDVEQDVEKGADFLLVGLPVLREVHLLPAEGLVDLGDLVGVEVDFPHHVLIQLQADCLLADPGLDAAFFLEQLNKELAEDVDAGEDVAEVALHDVLLVLAFEADGLRPHLIEVLPLEVLVIGVLFHVDLVVLLDEDGLDGQQDDEEETVLRDLLLSAHQQDLAEARVQRQEGKHVAQLGHGGLLGTVKDSSSDCLDLQQGLERGLDLLVVRCSREGEYEDVRNADGLELEKDAIKRQLAYLRQRVLFHDIGVESRGVETIAVAVGCPARSARSLLSHRSASPTLSPLPNSLVVAVLFLSRVDDVADVGNRERGLRDVGGNDEFPAVGRRWLEDPLLLSKRQGGIEAVNLMALRCCSFLAFNLHSIVFFIAPLLKLVP